ncbi:MAG: 2-C-methyl-D-erythritol 2,4-cyclodiphosphate synthase [Gaiellales bacterium]|jgi:2-C-methyl-D-erythritol 2,4-cyclodiphosphate synthase|nr:2-C-methyl-D-erythritol 2,4-cyclodiphosphate synthase [Gaiellales bacterium]MDX6545146.1 2-C-methyl-D-erythritol 2,4-cyclodiphosphate synthase [Gaiellales bacterium]MDX6550225.1 2-C-methyl-D-erythritol 2,4-cyclodiphosphate synthase [Gaiellales bacterium]
MADDLRVGIGFDAHAFADGRRLVLAGVEVQHTRGLAGHSDADLIAHAVTDALLGAAGGEDIGALFPSHDPSLEGASSIELLGRTWNSLAAAGWSIVNVDAIVIMQEPRIAPYRDQMRDALAAALLVGRERVTVRASTTDHLGFAGRGEGAACQAVALLARPASGNAGR